MSADAYQSTLEKLQRAREGDAQAREELISENLALVKYIVKRFSDRGAEFDDLFQYGCIGLMKAIDRFDGSYSVRFSTYAVPVIMGEIRRYLRDDHPVHISRTIHERAKRIEAYIEKYTLENQRSPEVDQIAEALDLKEEDVLLAMNSRGRIFSLDEPVGADSELRLKDVLGTQPMAAVDLRLTLSKLLGDLKPEERALIVRRYFKAHTQAQIASDMGTSQVQISRMESRILKRMRALAGTEDG